MKNRLKHLDAAAANLQFLLQVLLDGVLDLRPPHVVPHAADLLAQAQDPAVVEADELAAGLGVDLRHREAVWRSRPARSSRTNRSAPFLTVTDFSFGPSGRLHVDAELGLDALLVVDLLDADEGVVGRRPGRRRWPRRSA